MNIDRKGTCDVSVTTISANGQFQARSSSIVFWNQGTTEVVIDSNFRLAPAVLDPLTGLLRGGEAYRFEDPTGRILEHTFNFVFKDPIIGEGPFKNNLTVQMMTHLDDYR